MLRRITVCYDTLIGEILSWVVQTSSCSIEDFKCCLIEGREIDILEIPYSQELEEKLSNYKKVRVDVNSKKLVYAEYSYTIRNVAWGQLSQDEKRLYTHEELLKMYNDHYVNFNIGKLLDLSAHEESLMEIKWIKITDIQLRDSILTRPWKKFHTDPFLNKYHGSKIELAKDILENGNLWPNVTSIGYVERHQKSGDTGLFSFEGNHRVPALLLAQARGVTPDNRHRVFAIHFKSADKGYYWCKRSKKDKLPENVRQRLPIDVAFGSECITDPEYKKKCDKIMDEVVSFEKIDDMTLEVTVDNWSDLVRINQVYPHYLRDIIANYNKTAATSFKGHRLFKDKDYIEQWSIKYAPKFYSQYDKNKILEYHAGSFAEEMW